jgi:cytochrome c peroxidase
MIKPKALFLLKVLINKPTMHSLKNKIILLLFISVYIFSNSCNKNPTEGSLPDSITSYLNIPVTPYNYANPSIPAYLLDAPIVAQINTPADNPITDWGATLGRVLFFDKHLSKNLTISCASCHKQENAFSDFEKLSKGFLGGFTGRNSMTLINAKYYPNGRFFWDQRASSLERQTLMPIQDLVEMGMTLDSLVKRVQDQTYYPPLFIKAFGNTAITIDLISKALAQYVRSIVSYQSKYDQGRQNFPNTPPPPPNAPFPNFTAEENRGKEIFFNPQNACAGCHGSETFTSPGTRNNGLDATVTDRGFGIVTNNPDDNGLFKVGSLRNIELTAPYMHDGRFASLEEVIEHYSTGVKNHPNLSQQLKLPNGQARLLNLSAQDKNALVAFLITLTDRNITKDIKFSNPFK